MRPNTGSSSGSSGRCRPRPTRSRGWPPQLKPCTDRRPLPPGLPGLGRERPALLPLLPSSRRCPCKVCWTSGGKTSAGPSGCRPSGGRTGLACVDGLGDLRTKPVDIVTTVRKKVFKCPMQTLSYMWGEGSHSTAVTFTLHTQRPGLDS